MCERVTKDQHPNTITKHESVTMGMSWAV